MKCVSHPLIPPAHADTALQCPLMQAMRAHCMPMRTLRGSLLGVIPITDTAGPAVFPLTAVNRQTHVQTPR